VPGQASRFEQVARLTHTHTHTAHSYSTLTLTAHSHSHRTQANIPRPHSHLFHTGWVTLQPSCKSQVHRLTKGRRAYLRGEGTRGLGWGGLPLQKPLDPSPATVAQALYATPGYITLMIGLQRSPRKALERTGQSRLGSNGTHITLGVGGGARGGVRGRFLPDHRKHRDSWSYGHLC
jgi:hypothetical protein